MDGHGVSNEFDTLPARHLMLQLRADHLSGEGIPCGAEPHILTYGLYFFARIAQSARGYISQLFLSVSVRATHCQPVECIFTAGLWWFVCAQQTVNLRILFRRFVCVFCAHIRQSYWLKPSLGLAATPKCPRWRQPTLRTMSVIVLTLGAGKLAMKTTLSLEVLTVLHDGTTFMTNGHVLTAVRDAELVHSPCFADTCRAP